MLQYSISKVPITMLESSYSFQVSKSNTFIDQTLITFAFTFPWIAISSLVQYYSENYGKEYFVYLFFTYHCIALPVLYVEEQIDFFVMALYGPHTSKCNRPLYGILILVLALLAAPYAGEFGLILLCGLVGGCTWLCARRTVAFATPSLVGLSNRMHWGLAAPIVFCMVYTVTAYSERDHYSRYSVKAFFYCAAALQMTVTVLTVSTFCVVATISHVMLYFRSIITVMQAVSRALRKIAMKPTSAY
jgi:hypothetical protein